MSYYLPYEIQSQIMKRLPVKSLVQFKSVSKAWKSFILSSEFIADYNAWNSDQHCLLVTCADKNYKEKHELIVDDDTFPLRKLSHTIPSSVNLITSKVAMFGSSQGLFCYCGYTDGDKYEDLMAVIWNPSVPKSVDIVVPRNRKPWLPKLKTVLGFGVCPRTLDPKLVKITFIETDEECDEEDDDEDDDGDAMQVEVFTLSSGAWKSLSTNLPHESIRFKQNSVDLDGFIYWLAYEQGYRKCYNNIMSFDMTSEKFTEISLPSTLIPGYIYLSISKRMESLVMLHSNFWAGKHEVWMMEGGVEKSFTKLFTIEAPEANRVLGFRNNGEPIIIINYNGYPEKNGVYLYEPNSRHISYVGISAETYIELAGSCTNTLLLLDR